jgi:hypothetical protein
MEGRGRCLYSLCVISVESAPFVQYFNNPGLIHGTADTLLLCAVPLTWLLPAVLWPDNELGRADNQIVAD